MRSADETDYRLRLAEGFLAEARQDVALQRWRSCADNSQLAVENAAKAALALLGPVGRTHNPALLLQQALDERRFPEAVRPTIERLVDCARQLGPTVHLETDYGDERTWRTPWELFDQPLAQEALALAEEAVALAKQVIEGGQRP
jgi:HEPN domain-containing protein